MEWYIIVNYKQKMAIGQEIMVDHCFLCQVNICFNVLVIMCNVIGLIIVCHVTGVELEKPQKLEMIRYLRNVQNPDGGWGL